jgi:hypothetical protein
MHKTDTRIRRVAFGTLAALGGLGALALGGPALAQMNDRGKMLDEPAITARLDIGGGGNFTGLIDSGKNELCYMLDAAGIGQATRAVIEDAQGAPLITLATPDARGGAGECKTISPAATKALLSDADDYALEVDSKTHPDGEVRAPLHFLPSEA